MTSPGHYHLLLAARERPVQHGWWGSEDVARDKFRDWLGLYGAPCPAPASPCQTRTTATCWTHGPTGGRPR